MIKCQRGTISFTVVLFCYLWKYMCTFTRQFALYFKNWYK